MEIPGVYGRFAFYKLGPRRAKELAGMEVQVMEEFLSVVQAGRGKGRVDTYLGCGIPPGLVESALTRDPAEQPDFFARLEGTALDKLKELQRDLEATSLGSRLKKLSCFTGVTRPPDYAKPHLAGLLSVTPAPGPKKYAVVIPVTKTEEWYALPAQERQAMIDEEVRVASAYLDRVARKLYHGDGLDRHDFVTYFETSDIPAFAQLLRSLQGLGQFKYFAFPQAVYIGAPKSVQETLSYLLGREAEVVELAGGVTVVPASPREGGQMTVRYNGLLARSGAGQVFLHMGHGDPDAWHNVCESKMTDTLNRGREHTFALHAPAPVNFCFRDGLGNWDNNYGRNWTCPPPRVG